MIETEGLSKSFGGLRAVDDLCLDVPAGVVFGFLGPNGAGKTTTIRMLLGLMEPTSGEARVLGFDVRTQAARVRERVGVLLDNDGLYERLTAYDNLDYYGEIYRLSRTERQSRIRRLLEHMGLWDRRNERVRTYSRGMRQKLGLARAILHGPLLVFLDEPTSGLDAVSAVSLREGLRNLALREGVTVFLTTHNLAEAEKVCDRVAVIHRGRLIAEGLPSEIGTGIRRPRLEIAGYGFTPGMVAALESRPEVERVALGEDGLTIDLNEGASAAPLVRLLVDMGAGIEEVRKQAAGLEEAFIALLKEQQA
ncbi:MAG: ABC transporter ATP-binding protein [Firmicutes bacterium]|nr:ABC transporter ATP-binding protein [Bacillota bacterium]